MIVELAADVLEDPTAFDSVDKIMFLILEGRHYLRIDINLEQTAWFRSLGDRHRKTYSDVVRRSYNLSLRRGFGCVKVTRQIGPKALRPELAYKYLCECLTVVLENVDSDGAFMHMVIAKFSPKHLLPSYNGRSLRFRAHGGSGGIWACVENLQKDLLSMEHLRESGLSCRLLIFRDSDAMFPGHVRKEVKSLISKCESQGITVFCTRKREIENYLPIKVLRYAFVEGKPALMSAFESLKQEQRDHFDMKDGFSQRVPPEQVSLFADVTPEVMNQLGQGFHQDLWKLFERYLEPVSKRDFDSSASMELSELVKAMELLC